ncbi:gamma-glutamylcyclotransferase [Phyllobacterium endophyticum]|uniref:Gamma-glutamylcyclotransferase n=2 Tax=Phyllobacterium endophyticum TaxID=1149773 RepID=A0A2P7AU20_9HYPH|nr:gamma-glutamylcyclotransferase [Phyllobacterium endophyticum]TYR43919.1 gamma-glutamylcyclotransferase [Phyllobacterium endophyticum]
MANVSMDDIKALAKNGRLVAYFGYGSLVNRQTLRTNIVEAVPARLHGWRRLWRPSRSEAALPAALLSVCRDEGSSVDGLLVFDHLENLASVDLREENYDRRSIEAADIETAAPLPEDVPIYVYEAHQFEPAEPVSQIILQSYLDAVMQGFLVEHGEEGLRRFVFKTGCFSTPIFPDRPSPAYPRAVNLSDEEIDMFDRLLAEMGANFTDVSRGGEVG